jgi:hypothetical protein
LIVVVEGPSAAGKTTWIAAHCQHTAVISEAAPEPSPGPGAAAAGWAQVNAARWAAATRAEQETGTAVCDTDPFKLHYTWCLWQTGHASTHQWRADRDANRQLFADQRLGIADMILVTIPDPAVLAARRRTDTTRTRRNFDLHAQLAGPLRDWYQAISRLDSSRVRWELPSAGLNDLSTLCPRNQRTGTGTFDSLIEQLPAR